MINRAMYARRGRQVVGVAWLVAAFVMASAALCSGKAAADPEPSPPPFPWPTGCQSPLVIGGTPAARRWCGEPVFGFGPVEQGAQPGAEPPR